jgi:hypothetical protein
LTDTLGFEPLPSEGERFRSRCEGTVGLVGPDRVRAVEGPFDTRHDIHVVPGLVLRPVVLWKRHLVGQQNAAPLGRVAGNSRHAGKSSDERRLERVLEQYGDIVSASPDCTRV